MKRVFVIAAISFAVLAPTTVRAATPLGKFAELTIEVFRKFSGIADEVAADLAKSCAKGQKGLEELFAQQRALVAERRRIVAEMAEGPKKTQLLESIDARYGLLQRQLEEAGDVALGRCLMNPESRFAKFYQKAFDEKAEQIRNLLAQARKANLQEQREAVELLKKELEKLTPGSPDWQLIRQAIAQIQQMFLGTGGARSF